MANPKVFEFAKEVGMTPLALMDKIREWKIPVKSHMSELGPDVLEKIRDKLSEAKPKKVTKAKRTVRKAKPKAAPPVKPETAAKKKADAGPKASVIRRKAKDIEAEAAALKAQAEEEAAEAVAEEEMNSAPEEAAVEAEVAPEQESQVAAEADVAPATTKKRSKKAEVSLADEAEVLAEASASPEATDAEGTAATQVRAKGKSTTKEATEKTAETDVVGAEAKAAEAAVPAAKDASKDTEAKPADRNSRETSESSSRPAVAKKREVVVGASGVASSPGLAQRKNIIGRMDLSRVSNPQQNQGYQQRNQYGGGSGPRPGPGQQGGAAGPGQQGRPAGFGGGPSRTGNRNLRAGFVAPSTYPDVNVPIDDSRRKEVDRKSKKLTGGGPAGFGVTPAKEKEGEVEQFNAVEFRKREMVFQPRKKKGVLNRVAMRTQITTPKASKRTLKVDGTMKVSDIAQELGIKAGQLVGHLMKNGVMANMNTDLDFDTIALMTSEFGWEAVNVAKSAEELVEETAFGDLDAEMVDRPPVVAVMGHVDHGKTSLLDAIRRTKVAAGEAGGITQHIGAYSVALEDGYEITFLDTPGHEAFTAMRARGANVTDVAIIVVAADDGMMPQTIEAINHAKAAKVPIIVAVNKIDKPGANVERIKQQLTELEIVPEEWGGSQIFCEVSALKRTGIQKLLESIKLVAEMLELKANPKRSGSGVIIESKIEKGKGPVATLLVKDGTVKVGNYIVAGGVKGRVRSLMNENGERIESMGPGYPVEVQGLDSTPGAGDKFDVVRDEATATEVSSMRRERSQQEQQSKETKLSMEDIFAKVNRGDVKDFGIILKADVAGSLEAIAGMIQKLPSKEVDTKIIHSAVGGISETDVLLAHTTKGIVIGFNVRPDGVAQQKAKQLGVDVRTYSIVYELMDDLKKAMTGLLTPDVVETVMGRAEVRNTFSVPKVGTIAGCMIADGKIQRSNNVRLVRDGKIIYDGKISSLKRFKDDAREVAAGFECGIGIENFNDVKVGDVIEAYVKEEKARVLSEAPAEA